MSREMVSNRVFHKRTKDCIITGSGMNLKTSKAKKTWCNTAHDGTWLQCLVPVVEHVAHDRLTRRTQREGAGCRYTQVVHRFAAEVFSD
jgi:hypothetical protein